MLTSGKAALEAAARYRPDLALVDLKLDGVMDGSTAARLIWERFRIPIVFLTGDSGDFIRAHSFEAETYGYLYKPFKPRDLDAALQIALNRFHLERKIQEVETWLRTTLSSITDAAITVDSAGTIHLFNRAAEILTGWKQAEAVGRDVLEVFRCLECESREPVKCGLLEAMVSRAERAHGATRILAAKDGVERLVRERTAAITDDAGHVAGVVVTFRAVDPSS